MVETILGRYHLYQVIGRGGMGEVYRAHDAYTKRDVALKRLSQINQSHEAIKRFQLESTSHLNHPHIVTLYESGFDEQDQPFLVMELLDKTYKEHLGNQVSDWQTAVTTLLPLCEALAYAHDSGVIHRDVKPSNIMFDKRGNLKLCDFGLAKWKTVEPLTRSGATIGTYDYMSPEQMAGKAIDARTDIYSLGLILIEAITGQNPQKGKTEPETISNILSGSSFNLPIQAQHNLPESLVSTLGKSVAPDRDDRYTSCQQLINTLQKNLSQYAPSSISLQSDEGFKIQNGAEPTIVNPNGLNHITPEIEAILRQMFAGEKTISIVDEYGAGFSNSRVFLVDLIPYDDSHKLPAVVKIAHIRDVNREWQAYEQCVKERLSKIAAIDGQPTIPPHSLLGGLRYQMAGDGIFKTQSLSQFYPSANITDVLKVYDRFIRANRKSWLHAKPVRNFNLAASYDPILPVNIWIELVSETAVSEILEFKSTSDLTTPETGQLVRLHNPVVTEIDKANNEVTLNLFDSETERINSQFSRYYRFRIQNVTQIDNFEIGLQLNHVTGIVKETRQEKLMHYAQEAFGTHFDLSSANLSLPDGNVLPNPIYHLSTNLRHNSTVKVGYIHGDLNPENILVDYESSDIYLIDFALARKDHVLHDLLRMETSILTNFLAHELEEANLTTFEIVQFFQRVHCVAVNPHFPFPIPPHHPALEKPYEMVRMIREQTADLLLQRSDWCEYYRGLTFYLLGALKFKNLTQTARRVSFIGAAVAQQYLEELPDCQHLFSQVFQGAAQSGERKLPFFSDFDFSNVKSDMGWFDVKSKSVAEEGDQFPLTVTLGKNAAVNDSGYQVTINTGPGLQVQKREKWQENDWFKPIAIIITFMSVLLKNPLPAIVNNGILLSWIATHISAPKPDDPESVFIMDYAYSKVVIRINLLYLCLTYFIGEDGRLLLSRLIAPLILITALVTLWGIGLYPLSIVILCFIGLLLLFLIGWGWRITKQQKQMLQEFLGTNDGSVGEES